MRVERSYQIAFVFAMALHLLIISLLTAQPSHQRPVLVKSEAQTQPDLKRFDEAKAIKAVSVSEEEVMQTVNQLKAQRAQQKEAERQRQARLHQQAEAARKQRIAEQKRLEKLKAESIKLAKEREQKRIEEQKRLQALAKQKKAEEKRLAEIKKQQIEAKKEQQAEAAKLAQLQAEKKRRQEALEQEKMAQMKAEQEQQRLAEIQRAKQASEKQARVAGEVDKYKALIINAISRQWILPDNVDSQLSSQFRIRLAPNGVVLEVSLTRSSGDPILDRSAQAAIYKASPLPVPSDPDAFNLFRDISLTVRPESARG